MYFPLYLVISSDGCGGGDFVTVAEQAILGGVDIIQLREKNSSTEDFLEKALRLKKLTDIYNVPLIINDNLEVAMDVDAAGIHVGNNDISPVEIRKIWKSENKIIGYSIEYLEQLDSENARAADYLAASPVFGTSTKTDTVTEWGLDGVAEIRKLTKKPLVAIGNLKVHNAASVVRAGADSIAVVSAICLAENPEKAAKEIKQVIMNVLVSS